MAYDKTQQKRIDSGCCKDCGNDRGKDGTSIYCRKCVTKISKRSYERQKLQREARRSAGLCPTCGEKPSDGLVCEPCKEKQRNYYHASKNARAKRKSQNRECSYCGNPRFHKSKMCEKHWYMNIAGKYGFNGRYLELAKLLEDQGFKCYYTGEEIIPGENASLDHLKSRSNSPELKDVTSNVVWVDRNINRMKGSLDCDDFISICKQVYQLHKDSNN